MGLSIGTNRQALDLVGQVVASARSRAQTQGQVVQEVVEGNTRRVLTGVEKTISAMQKQDYALQSRRGVSA
jgi:hypothetical protein